MEHVVNQMTLFDCCHQIEPFNCKTCPDFQTNFVAVLRHHHTNGHIESNSQEETYKCLRCSFVTSSRYLHLLHRLSRECASTNKDQKGDGTTFKLKEGPIGSPQESSKDIDWCKSGPSITSRRIGNRCIEPSHPKYGWWYCEQCPYEGKYKTCLLRHIKWRHSKPEDVQWFNCEQCSYRSKGKGDLKQHIKYRHSKPIDVHWFQCDQCPCKSKTSGDLKKHMIYRHSKPEDIHWFECDQCPYKSKENGTLKRHVTCCHSKPEDIQWVKCGQCDYKSKDKANLKKHVKYRHSKPKDTQFLV